MASKIECSCASNLLADPPWADANCFIVVTGASRGFGQALCIQLAKLLTAPKQARSLNFLIMARDLAALEKTASLIHSSKCPDSTTIINVMIPSLALDMARVTQCELDKVLQPFFNLSTSEKYHNAKQWNLLIHNAATVGIVERRADERTDIDYMQSYYHTNLYAPMLLTSLFLTHFAPHPTPHEPVTVINVSSLAAEQAFPCMTDYCTAKAARQMYFRSLAVDRPTVAVFNYSPGPLDTDMYTDLSMRIGYAPSRQMFQENKKAGRIIDPLESARVCVEWLRRRRSRVMDDEAQLEVPSALVCPVHDSEFTELWKGTRLDYYVAVLRCPKLDSTGDEKTQ